MRSKVVRRTPFAFLLAFSLLTPTLLGCSAFHLEEQEKTPDFSNARHICELSTLDAYYHNVVRVDHEASGPFAWFFRHGYKRMWFEYSGIVEFGVNFTKVSISEPDSTNTVTITLPQAEIMDIKIDEDSIGEPIIDTGFMTEFTTEEKTEALGNAQQEMGDAAEQDDSLKYQARERAKDMLESYVTNMGDLIGEEYTVVWVDV